MDHKNESVKEPLAVLMKDSRTIRLFVVDDDEEYVVVENDATKLPSIFFE